MAIGQGLTAAAVAGDVTYRSRNMYAVEFRAKVKNGTIEIPSQYRGKLKKVVRVIVLAEMEESTNN
jgi:hypothetical protein